MTVNIHKLLSGTLTKEYEVHKSKLEQYIASTLCPISDSQRKRLERTQVVPGRSGLKEIGRPTDLFETDPNFPGYVDTRIDWAKSTGGTVMVQRTKAVNAICKFHTPRFGWLDYKEEHESKRNAGTNRIKEERTGSVGGDDLSTGTESTEAYRKYLSELSRT